MKGQGCQRLGVETTGAREIVGVQYLRGLAALAVVLDHTSSMAALDKYFGESVFDGFLETAPAVWTCSSR